MGKVLRVLSEDAPIVIFNRLKRQIAEAEHRYQVDALDEEIDQASPRLTDDMLRQLDAKIAARRREFGRRGL